MGVNAIPIALKKATTHDVHPNVSIPKMKLIKGIAVLPFGSTLVKV